MLRQLRIKNFAIIEKLELEFGSGLNVLTGETGAGKSIIIGALGLALGERAYSEMIKTGSTSATVEACFDIHKATSSVLSSLGINADDAVILRREISSLGKNKAYINDTMASVQSLTEVGKTLVDIHGQHEHQSLLSEENQLMLIDIYGGLEKEVEEISNLFSEVSALKRKLSSLNESARDRAQRIDLLKFQINEIETASLGEGEDVALEEERRILSNLKKLNELLEASYSEIYSKDGSCIESLSKAVTGLKEMAEFDPAVKEPLGLLEEAVPLLEEAASALRSFRQRYDLDPARLEQVEERLHLIHSLKKKYGDSIEEILRYAEKIREELSAIENSEEQTAVIEQALREKEQALESAANSLSAKRKKSAQRLEAVINPALKELAMKSAEFRVAFKPCPVSSNGADSIEFLFSANPGEALKPLSKVASGGELSRIMLALKTALKEADDIPVLIFDEVDAGIGGSTADTVAQKLKILSAQRQVICITHLPQIASLADHHYLIEKKETKDRVNVIIKKLGTGERIKEIARMLSGSLTEASLRHAEELIGRTQEIKIKSWQ